MTIPIRPSEATLIEVRQALQRVELNRRTAPLHNFTATTDPTVTDDESEGYSVQSWWYNATSEELFLCTDATTDGAAWQNLTSAGILGSAFKTITPPDANSLVADSAADTLTITESGGGVTITGTTATDTLNIDVNNDTEQWNADRIASENVGPLSGASGDYLRHSGSAWVDVPISQVLTDLKTVDGTGSGLDADLLDGLEGAVYTLVDGTRAFTGVVGGIDPTTDTHLATKNYVDNAINFTEQYFLNDTASDIGGIYSVMQDTSTGEAESSFTTAGLGTGDDQALVNWATLAGVPGVITLEAGVYTGHIHAEVTAGNKDTRLYFAIYTRTSGGAETLRVTSHVSDLITSKTEVEIHAVLGSDVVINTTDRIVVKWFANVEPAGSNVTVVLYAEGTTASRVAIPITTEVLSSIFLRQDGTTPLTGAWAANNDITGVTKVVVDSLTLDGAEIVSSTTLTLAATIAQLTLEGTNFRLNPSGVGDDVLLTFDADAQDGTLTYMNTEDEFRFNTLVQATQLKSTGTLQVDGVATITGIATGGITDYDLKVGDTTTPDYGVIQFGNARIGRVSYNVGNIDLDGAILISNLGGPVTGDIELIVTESTGDTCRFAIPKSGAGLATYHPRSFCIAGPAPADTDFVKLSYWQGQGIFHNLTFDTVADGAQLGVQGDIECEATLYIDTIAESTTAAGVTVDGVLLKDGVVGIGYGGTGQTTAQAAINALSAVSGAANEHVLTKDTATGNAIFKVAAAGGGDVTAAANMGDHEIVRGDGGAKGVQDSPGVTIDDSANLAGLNSLTLADDKGMIFGASTDAKFLWDTSNTNHGLVLGLALGSAAQIGRLTLMELAFIGNANRDPGVASFPTLTIYADGGDSANESVSIWHNGVDGVINVGTGNLKLTSLTALDVEGNIIVSGTVDGVDIANGVILADGTNPLTAAWDAGSFQIRAETFQSDIATGTAPLVVASQTMVTNLNAEAVGGNAASVFLKHAGTVALSANWDAGSFKITTAQLQLEDAGTAKANLDIMQIVNPVNAADMDGTRTSILFRQARVTDTLLDAVRIGAEAADDWTATASTQDADFVIECREQGVMTEKFRITPDANGGFLDIFARIDSRRGDGVSNPFRIFSYADGASLSPQFSMRRARGTFASPTAVVNGTEIGALEWRGWDLTVGGQHRRKAQVRAVVDGAPSSNVVPMAVVVATSATSANPIDRLTIDSAGDVTLNTSGSHLNFLDANHYIEQANGMLAYNVVGGTGHRFNVQSTRVAEIDTEEIRFYESDTERGSLSWSAAEIELFTLSNVRAVRWTATATQIEKPTLIGSSTTAPATSAILELLSTTGALLLSRMTTGARNALTAVNGMVIYNSTTNAFNFYENGAWVSGSGLA